MRLRSSNSLPTSDKNKGHSPKPKRSRSTRSISGCSNKSSLRLRRNGSGLNTAYTNEKINTKVNEDKHPSPSFFNTKTNTEAAQTCLTHSETIVDQQ